MRWGLLLLECELWLFRYWARSCSRGRSRSHRECTPKIGNSWRCRITKYCRSFYWIDSLKRLSFLQIRSPFFYTQVNLSYNSAGISIGIQWQTMGSLGIICKMLRFGMRWTCCRIWLWFSGKSCTRWVGYLLYFFPSVRCFRRLKRRCRS